MAPDPPPSRIAGLVLAGGRSTRFGSEKAVALFRGRPMMAWPLAALAEVCEAVAVSARAGGGAAALARENDFEVLTDDPSAPEGPLAGVAAGMAWARDHGCAKLLTLPCDAPLVGPAELRRLIAKAGARGAMAVTAQGPEPLVALWPTSELPENLSGHPPLHAVLRQLGAVEVRFEDAAPFANMNYPSHAARGVKATPLWRRGQPPAPGGGPA